MYTYVQRPGCKKENTTMYVYIWAGSRTPTRAYVRRGLVYMAGSERRNSVVVVSTGRNGISGRVHREGLDGRGDGNEAWRTAKQRKRTSYGRNGGPVDREGCGVPQNGLNGPATSKQGSCSSGGVWRTAKRKKRTSYGRNGGPVDREWCGVPQNGGNGPPTVETGVLLIGRGVAYRKTDETDLLRSKRGSC